MLALLKNWFAARQTHRPHRRSQLRFEMLEDRWCPAVSVMPMADGTLYISGDEYSSDVAVTYESYYISVEDGAGGYRYQNVGSINVRSFDHVSGMRYVTSEWNYPLTNGLNGNIAIALGAGDDYLSFNFASHVDRPLNIQIETGMGKDSVWVLAGDKDIRANVNLNVRGGRFADEDSLRVQLHRVYNATVHVAAQMGPGNDFVDLQQTGDIGYRGHVLYNIRGEEGFDTLNFRAGSAATGQKVGIYHDSRLDVYMYGNWQNDTITFDYYGNPTGHLNVLAHGGEGNDLITGSITQPFDWMRPFRSGRVTARVLGADGDDRLKLIVTTSSLSSNFITDVSIDGGLGHDRVWSSDNVTVHNCEASWFGLSHVHASSMLRWQSSLSGFQSLGASSYTTAVSLFGSSSMAVQSAALETSDFLATADAIVFDFAFAEDLALDYLTPEELLAPEAAQPVDDAADAAAAEESSDAEGSGHAAAEEAPADESSLEPPVAADEFADVVEETPQAEKTGEPVTGESVADVSFTADPVLLEDLPPAEPAAEPAFEEMAADAYFAEGSAPVEESWEMVLDTATLVAPPYEQFLESTLIYTL